MTENGTGRGPMIGVVALLALNLAAVGSLAWKAWTPPTPIAWEYRTEFFLEGGITTGMNTAGGEGWEAVSTRRANNAAEGVYPAQWGAEVLFRRPKR